MNKKQDSDQYTIDEALDVAKSLAQMAGGILQNEKGKFKILNYKDKQDILTNIDLQIEKAIIDKISQQFPNHNIYSEEAGEISHQSPYTWVIDPLDGTKEFIRDIPLYCSAIMLEKNGVPIVSAIYDPVTNELFSASLGGGAFLNEHPIHVSAQSKLENAMFFAYLPRNSREMKVIAPFFDLMYRIRGHANINISSCWVAKGGYEGSFFITQTHWWDAAPGILILREAGGRVTNLDGQDITRNNYRSMVFSSNGHVHEELLAEARKVLK